MVLGGYFDESERNDARDPISVGGYVFKPGGYQKFRKRWRHALKVGGRRCEPFHMTDLVAGKGVYDGVSIADRMVLLDHAVAAVTSHAYTGVVTYCDRDEFEAFAPPEWPQVYGSIYTASCQLCVALTAQHLMNTKRCHLKVQYVFEEGHKFQAEADAILSAVRANPEAMTLYSYRNHLFEDKNKEYGLQAADLLAWTATKLLSGAYNAPGFAPFLPAIMRISGKDESHVACVNLTGDKLKHYIASAVATYRPELMTVNLGPRKRAFR